MLKTDGLTKDVSPEFARPGDFITMSGYVVYVWDKPN